MDIDTPDTCLFNSKEWIGVGKMYKDIPSYVALACTEATAIPSDIQDMLPQKDETIVAFVQQTLPLQSNVSPPRIWTVTIDTLRW